ncbi:hypothetical protein BZB76_2538 [Actinomadura pelletieri DSM 43383]|uniref:Uncharacterized protein n=1 Tax=Actinomadura pelletieri DSM 43383 TaxID=1120940 RepID=A0A495QUS9_9ACTN|nr:hypothetical protein [Actinomadura pelletieri]RKS77163.1 hypothetical protein BZB76_2538 [Actinomadura pelletieri DSM 43383]
MNPTIRRICRDLRDQRHVESYVVALAATATSALSLFTDLVDDDVRWSVVIAGIGLMVYQVTVPEGNAVILDDLLKDRTAFEEDVPLEARLRRARELWLFAPSGAHLLTSTRCDTLRRHVLDRDDGSVRIVLLDPERPEAVALATRQLTDAVDFPGQPFSLSLERSLERLTVMRRWGCRGHFSCRLLPYNPGFSLIALDPSSPGGSLIVEFHGAHNRSTADRMHLTLTRRDGGSWYEYWLGQFEHIWGSAREAPFQTDDVT